MMSQYRELKRQYADCLLLFRLGDFYELFYDDAVTAAQELEITLTGRDAGNGERAPMCGVPYHAVEGYVARLVG
jgi:DNA mismatch repair protein MutS